MEKEKDEKLEEEIFRRSKKVVRSPGNKEDKGKQGSKGEGVGGRGGGERAEEDLG